MKKHVLAAAALLTVAALTTGCSDNQFEQETAAEKQAVTLAREAQQGGYQLITVEELKNRLDGQQDMLIIDTMPYDSSFKKGHIPGAKNFVFAKQATDGKSWAALTEDNQSEQAFLELLGPDKSRTIVMYCGFVACGRSHNAAIWAVNQGYENVYRLPGGIFAWRGAGYPVEEVK
ncbi:sulfurtransferase [Plesiomonas shigelloides]|uniref:rhodanese-like domain-containing protein n=1 Tax=Plesiomonas shigelloides TaxID=703 RepID=UPI000D57FDCC|nr:rhodanese-like domain-containing protein [Plesiomonas shigelloides]PVU65677.1 sulfurtransferase [Plesiomonas shigelloides]